ncbi:MAG TPA: DUF2267 domain-containing protein [Anaerolineales bacterium]|nr:DUF2267 domain-containing protein [Anaerolineales bacterium]
MPMPFEYQNASLEFERFMVDARDFAGLATTNMAWNMVVGVLHTFRRRLTAPQGIAFAGVLPPVLRALFIEGWDLNADPVAFSSSAELLAEVRSVRHAHNFSPDNAISAVAAALRRHVDVASFEQVLPILPPGSRTYWAVPET